MYAMRMISVSTCEVIEPPNVWATAISGVLVVCLPIIRGALARVAEHDVTPYASVAENDQVGSRALVIVSSHLVDTRRKGRGQSNKRSVMRLERATPSGEAASLFGVTQCRLFPL